MEAVGEARREKGRGGSVGNDEGDSCGGGWGSEYVGDGDGVRMGAYGVGYGKVRVC